MFVLCAHEKEGVTLNEIALAKTTNRIFDITILPSPTGQLAVNASCSLKSDKSYCRRLYPLDAIQVRRIHKSRDKNGLSSQPTIGFSSLVSDRNIRFLCVIFLHLTLKSVAHKLKDKSILKITSCPNSITKKTLRELRYRYAPATNNKRHGI